MYILKTLYDSFILPHLNYAILTWGFSCSRIFKLQKKINKNYISEQI